MVQLRQRRAVPRTGAIIGSELPSSELELGDPIERNFLAW